MEYHGRCAETYRKRAGPTVKGERGYTARKRTVA